MIFAVKDYVRHFVTNARKTFIHGNMETKKNILTAIGQNPAIKKGKLSIETNACLVPIKNIYPKHEKDYLMLGLLQVSANKERSELLNPASLE